MQNVKPLLLLLLTYSLLSCETTKPALTTSGFGKTSRCGETLVGVTTEKHKIEVVGATLKDFSLGEYRTEVTPEFQRIASETSMNEDSKVKIACTAMEKSGGEPSDERLTYYLNLLGFLSSTPPHYCRTTDGMGRKVSSTQGRQGTIAESHRHRNRWLCSNPTRVLRRPLGKNVQAANCRT